MIRKVFAIRDVKVETFFPPFCQQNQLEAQRTFLDLCNNQQTPISQHPEDYTLYEIGTFDNETGALQSIVARVCLVGEKRDAA